MNNENNVIEFPVNANSESEAMKSVEREMDTIQETVELAKPPISDYIDRENPVPISEAKALPISGDAPVGIVISGGESKVVTEIPAEVRAMMEADGINEQTAQEVMETPVLNEEDPLNEVSQKQLGQLMNQVREMMSMFEAQWNNTRKEFQLTESHMRQLYAYNEEHVQPMPEGKMGEVEAQIYDQFNGLDSLTEEKALEIFGEDHPMIGLEHSITLDRVKSVIRDFFSWTSAVQEYRQIHDAYMQLIELQEEKEIDSLKKYCDNEQDPEKKAKMQEAIDLYYNRKYLDFLAEPLDENKLQLIVKAFSDESKIQYLINRSRVKLGQMKISGKFILEISQIEKRFLPEEYHGNNNIFLIYFMNLVTYCDVYNKKDADRNKVACIVFGMDKFVRNVWSPEIKEKILNNLIEFQKQFIDKLPKPVVTTAPQETVNNE